MKIGETAPDFEAETTKGRIRFHDWIDDSWAILFSHPKDFTPVCTTEFIEFARRSDEFERKNVALLGNSVDSVYSHIAWMRNIEEKFGVRVPFPVIADLDQKVSRLYGMIHQPSSATAAVRCVFFATGRPLFKPGLVFAAAACASRKAAQASASFVAPAGSPALFRAWMSER